MPAIKGILETSFIDWPGRMCAVLFLGGCNFRCPFCHNHPLVLHPSTFESHALADVLLRLAPYRKWFDAICISGGEPTLQPGLQRMLKTLKSKNWAIKLDTNGSRPEVLTALLEDGLLDMISMDVKAPLELSIYNRCAGLQVDLDSIRKSIALILESRIDHEFRMTVLPGWHSRNDIIQWRDTLAGSRRLTLQNFNPRTTLAPDLERQAGFAPEIFAEFKALLTQ